MKDAYTVFNEANDDDDTTAATMMITCQKEMR